MHPDSETSSAISAPSDLFDALVESARSKEAREALFAQKHHDDLVELATGVRSLAFELARRTFPEEASDREGWLLLVERLDLAAQGSRALAEDGTRWAADLAQALDEAASRRTKMLEGRSDLWPFARLAQERLASLGNNNVRPWAAVRCAADSGLLDDPGKNPSELLEAWSAGGLSTRDDAALREKVRREGAWQDAYRDHLRLRLNDVCVPGGDPALNVEPERPWLIVPLPHLGSGQELEARWVLDKATWTTAWTWPGANTQRVVAPGVSKLVLEGDGVTGSLESMLDWASSTPIDEASRAVNAVHALAIARVEDEPNVRRLVAAIGRALTSSAFLEQIGGAESAFLHGNDPADTEEDAIRIALEARLWLDDAAASLMPCIVEEGAHIDKALNARGAGSALMLLDVIDYWELVGDRVLDPECWWGGRSVVEAAVPDEAIDDGLEVERRRRLAAAARIDAAADRGLPQGDRWNWIDSTGELVAFAQIPPTHEAVNNPEFVVDVLKPKDASKLRLGGIERPVVGGCARFRIGELEIERREGLDIEILTRTGATVRASRKA